MRLWNRVAHSLARVSDHLILSRREFRALRDVGQGAPARFVFVCKGNVCRSPYAAAVVNTRGLHAVSCGLDVRVSRPAEPIGVTVARQRGIDLSSHRSRSIQGLELGPDDCLIAMEPNQLATLEPLRNRVGCQLTLLGVWRTPRTTRIPDPYGKQADRFHEVFELIEQSIDGLMAGRV